MKIETIQRILIRINVQWLDSREKQRITPLEKQRLLRQMMIRIRNSWQHFESNQKPLINTILRNLDYQETPKLNTNAC